MSEGPRDLKGWSGKTPESHPHPTHITPHVPQAPHPELIPNSLTLHSPPPGCLPRDGPHCSPHSASRPCLHLTPTSNQAPRHRPCSSCPLEGPGPCSLLLWTVSHLSLPCTVGSDNSQTSFMGPS